MLAAVDPENGAPATIGKKSTVTVNRVPLGDRSNWQVKPIVNDEDEKIVILETDESSEVEVEVDWDEEGNPIMTTSVSKEPEDEVKVLKEALREALEENKALWAKVKEQAAEIALLKTVADKE